MFSYSQATHGVPGDDGLVQVGENDGGQDDGVPSGGDDGQPHGVRAVEGGGGAAGEAGAREDQHDQRQNLRKAGRKKPNEKRDSFLVLPMR